MSRFMSAMWVIEVVLLLAAGVVCLVRPGVVFYVLEECDIVHEACKCCTAPGPLPRPVPAADADRPCTTCCVPRGLCTNPEQCCDNQTDDDGDRTCTSTKACPECAKLLEPGRKACVIVATDLQAHGLFAFVRMLAPFLLTFAALAGHAAMREDEALRRDYSFIFAWVYVTLTVLVSTDGFSGHFNRIDFYFRALFAALVTFVLFSLFEALRGADQIQRSLSLIAAALYAAVAFADQRSHHLTRIVVLSVALSVIDTMIGGYERLRGRVFALVVGWPVVFVVTDPLAATLFHEHRPRDVVGPAIFSATILERRPGTQLLLAFIVLAVLCHALYAVWPADPAARRLSGTANTRPSTLWALWLGQGILFIAAAVVLVMTHRSGEAGMLKGMAETPGYLALFTEMKNLYPALLVAMALLSFTGMQASREWVWKALCSIFCVFYAALFLDLLLVWSGALFRVWVLGLWIPVVVLFGAHLGYLWSYRDWFSEEVGEGPDGWIAIDLVMGPYMLLRTLLTGKRAFHAAGVATWGKLEVLERGAALYPEHDFFFPSSEALDVQIRFSNERSEDDAAVDARGAALRMTRPSDGRRFDLMLTTGAYSAAENVVDQGLVTLASALGKPGRRCLAKSRQFLEGGIAALRRAPQSYTQLFYYAQTIRFWVARNDERYLVRYRLAPLPLPDAESGLPVTAGDFVDRARRAGEHRPPDYLRRELKMRLEGQRTESFRLQAQFHRMGLGDGVDWYNPAADWKTTEHPWVDVAEITLEDVLSDEDGEKLGHDPDVSPQSLGTPVARGAFDYRSIADSERRVTRRVEDLRGWRTEAFGMPANTTKRG
jgi:hypothetical protein